MGAGVHTLGTHVGAPGYVACLTYRVTESESTETLQVRDRPCHELCWEPPCLLIAELEALLVT